MEDEDIKVLFDKKCKLPKAYEPIDSESITIAIVALGFRPWDVEIRDAYRVWFQARLKEAEDIANSCFSLNSFA